MQGFTRAVGRLLVMGLVMTAVLVVAIYAGVATTTAIAAGIVLAGSVGIVMAARRPRSTSAADEIAAMMASPTDPPRVTPALSPTKATSVDAMAPRETKSADAEPFVPRWRRQSLLEARRSDPTRQAPVYRVPMRFIDTPPPDADVRVVRYAVVPVLDRPDEVLGLRLNDLEAGDEVLVHGSSGAFLEVSCPNGDRGWVHRTTVGQRAPVPLPASRPHVPQVSQEADDALTALLTARGLI
ncbi:MAG: hypothetical protein L0227_18445, partial [Chloroflexi bacterium]|nr:hypothetical protein [Chloroflexota bacterium]